MVIVINARFLLYNCMEGYGNYIEGVFTRVAAAMPQYHFHFILDRPNQQPPQLPANAQYVVLGPQARHPLLWHYWYNITLANYCKKVKAILCISPDGFCALTGNTPKITVIHDLAYIEHSEAIYKSHLWYYKNYTPKFIKKSKAIVTVSSFTKQTIIQHYKTPEQKINIIPNAANPLFKPATWEQQLIVKEQFSIDTAYFICVTSIHPRKNILNLLKAFSIFKKWTKSNMQLVLVGRMAWKNENFEKLMATYKYKNDVKLLGYLPTQSVASLVAAAYAMVYPSLYEGFGVPIIEAMQCAVPVITNNSSGMLEAGGDAALFADVTNPKEIATQMQLIYKDENLRSKKIEWGLQHCKQYNWDISANKMVTVIEDVLKN
jgi:glycosyltransferase involved in cell wall biosynthesis